MNEHVVIGGIERWGIRGGLGLLDQAFFSAANFVLNILLARSLSAEMYGVFSATFSVFLLIATVQTSLIAEPMSILGADKYKDRTVEYLDHLLWVQWMGSLAVAFIIGVVAGVLRDQLLRENLVIMALALPFMLLYWYLRRALYLRTQSGFALVASIAYFGIQILVAFILLSYGPLSPIGAYSAMAVSSLVASLPILRRLNLRFLGTRNLKTNPGNPLGDEQWALGKWLLVAYATSWVTTLSYPLLITFLIGHQFAGVFRGVQNLFLPVQQFFAAITLLILPALARRRLVHGAMPMFGLIRGISILVGSMAAMYCVGIIAYRTPLMVFLYDSDLYASFSWLVPFVALATLMGTVHLVPGLGLRVLRRTDYILWSKAASVIFLVFVGLPLMWAYKINGVLISLVAGACIEALILLFLFVKTEKNAALLPQYLEA